MRSKEIKGAHPRQATFQLKPLVKNVSIALAISAATVLNANLAYAEEGAPAQAEDKSKVEGVALPSVTVTSQKREESVQEVKTAITALGGKDLLDQGVGRSASEVLNYVPNASAGTQQHGRPRWWIRGVGAGQQQYDLSNPVGFYLDEVYISNASATGFPLFDIERVEVLRGPQGTLWGKNTTGGAVSVVSKKPSFNTDAKDNYVKVDYGSYNDRIVQGGVGGVIIDERLAGRVSFLQEDQDGRLKNQYTGSNDSGLSEGAIRGQLLAVLTPDLEALLNVHYRKYETDGAITTTRSYAANGVFRNGYKPSKDIKHVSTNAPDSSDNTQNGVSLNLKWQLGRLALTSITGYEDFQSEIVTDNDYTPLEISRSHTDGKSRQFTQEFRLASPKEDRWNWLAGAHYFNENVNFSTQGAKLPSASVPGLAGAPPGATYNKSDLTHNAESFALFGSNTYNFTDQFNATLGVRWTRETKEYDLNRKGSTGTGSWSNLAQWWSTYTGAYAAAGPSGSGTFSAKDSKTWNALTYDITPEYKITPHDRVYAKYSHGEKSGGFNTAATSLAAVNTVKPEQLDAYEVGYKSEWLDGRLNFNTSLFHYNYKDVQVNVVGFNANANTTVSYLQNAKKATVNGAEFEVEALPLENLHVNASLGLLDADYDSLQVVNGGSDLSGRSLVRSPHVTAQLAADYRIPVRYGKVIIGADARYQAKQYYFIDPQSEARGHLNQEAYTLANARISFATHNDKYLFTGYVNNLFDKEYKNHSLPAFNAAQGVNGDSIYWAAPRTVGVSVTTRW